MVIISATPRTDQEIVDQTNSLARICLAHLGTGYEAPEDHKFYESEHPRSKAAWQRACEIMEHMTATDPNDALANLEGEIEHEYLFDVKLFASLRVKAKSEEEARALMAMSINCNTANLGAWPNGNPIICEISLDCPANDELVEIDGEPVE